MGKLGWCVIISVYLVGCQPSKEAALMPIAAPRQALSQHPMQVADWSEEARHHMAHALASAVHAKLARVVLPDEPRDVHSRLLAAKVAYLNRRYRRARRLLQQAPAKDSPWFSSWLVLRALTSQAPLSQQVHARLQYPAVFNGLTHQKWLFALPRQTLVPVDTTQYPTVGIIQQASDRLSHPWHGVDTSVTPEAWPSQVGVVLPLSGSDASRGQAIQAGMLRAYQYLVTGAPITLHFFDQAKHPLSYWQAQPDAASITQWLFPLLPPTVNRANIWDASIWATKRDQLGLKAFDPTPLATRMRHVGISRVLVLGDAHEDSHQVVKQFLSAWHRLSGQAPEVVYLPSRHGAHAIAHALKTDESRQRIQAMRQLVRHTLRAKLRAYQGYDAIFLAMPPKRARYIVPLLRYHYYSGRLYGTTGWQSPRRKEDAHDLSGVIYLDAPWKQGKAPVWMPPSLASAWPKEAEAHTADYAWGFDAIFLIYERALLKQYPFASFAGMTGNWSWAHGQWHRQLSWGQYRQGRLVALDRYPDLMRHRLFVNV